MDFKSLFSIQYEIFSIQYEIGYCIQKFYPCFHKYVFTNQLEITTYATSLTVNIKNNLRFRWVIDLRLTFCEVDALDGPDISISFDEFDVLDGREHEFRADVVGVDDQGVEHPIWSHLCLECLVEFDDVAHV